MYYKLFMIVILVVFDLLCLHIYMIYSIVNCEHYFFYLMVSSISANMNNIPVLNGTNFKKWKEHIMIVLGCIDLDYALRFDRPTDLNETSTNEEKSAYKKWE